MLSSGLRRAELRRRLEGPESSGGEGGKRPVLSWVILEHDDGVQSHRRRKRRRQGPVKHWSRVQRFEGPEVEGRGGGWHGSRVTSGSLQPDSCFYPKLNKVSSLTQQVLLEDVP